MGVAMTLEEQKKAARGSAFARRKIAFGAQNEVTCEVLSEVLGAYRGAPLAGFMPINTEIDPLPAMVEASAHGMVGVPVIKARAKPLEFAKWDPETEMVAGAFKVEIPAFIEWIVPEIILVPLVAWDKEGGRLGYGGGFYDRTLERLRARGPILAIGFAFNAQEDHNLPLEPTDQFLDMLITEDRILKVKD